MDYLDDALDLVFNIGDRVTSLGDLYPKADDLNYEDWPEIGDRVSVKLDEFQREMQSIFKATNATVLSALHRLEDEVVMAHYRGELNEDQIHRIVRHHINFTKSRKITERVLELLNSMNSEHNRFGAAHDTALHRADASINSWNEASIEYGRRLAKLLLHVSSNEEPEA